MAGTRALIQNAARTNRARAGQRTTYRSHLPTTPERTKLVSVETLRDLSDREAPLSWRRALGTALALSTRRLPERPALIADGILFDGDRVYVATLPAPERRPDEEAGDGHYWARDSAVQLWKNMVDREAILRDNAVLDLNDIRVPCERVYMYMSPEQLMGKPLDEASHVYSIGVIAYELLTKRLPFEGAKGAAGIITAQLKQEPPAPSTFAPAPPEVDALISRCLRKVRSERFANLVALAREIEELLASAPTRDRE